MEHPEFVIVGAGAMGSVLAARLIAADRQVAVVARGQRATQLQERGLVIRGLLDLDCPCRVITDPGLLETTQTLVLAVKTYAHRSALKAVAHLHVGQALSMANGVVKNADIAEVLGAAAVIGCLAEFSAEMDAEGVVTLTRDNGFVLGESDGRESERLAALAANLRGAGWSVQSSSNIRAVEWSKFVGWVPGVVLSVLTRQPTGRFFSDPGLADVATRLVRELATLAEAMGISLRDQPPLPVASMATAADGAERLRAFGEFVRENLPGHRVSSLQDLERGKPVEVEETLGHALRLGRRHAIELPLTALFYELLSGINRIRAEAGQS